MSELETETVLVVAALEAAVLNEADVAFWGLVGDALRGREHELTSLAQAALRSLGFHDEDLDMQAFLRTLAASDPPGIAVHAAQSQ
jgi:hypothetical protein